VESVVAFLAALVTMRLAGDLAGRYRTSRAPAVALWSAGLAAYSLACAALAWGAAAGWDDRAFRVYYLFGGLLTAALLGCGSLAAAGMRRAVPLALVYAGLATGLALAAPLDPHVTGGAIPAAQEHLELLPARLAAVIANTLGTVALVAVALRTLRRHPVANVLVLAGVGLAAAGSAVAGLGEAGTSAFVAGAAALLYVGFVSAAGDALSPRALLGRLLPTPDLRS
jgi:hypothetical protein